MTTQHPEFSLKATDDGFNVFSGPGNSYDRVKHGDSDSAVFILPRARDETKDPASYVSTLGTTNTILGKYAAKALWYRIQVANGSIDITGWIRAAHVESDDDLSGVPVAWKPIRLSLDSNANVRSGPGRGHARVGFIAGGSTDRYDILGRDAATATWYQIRFSPTVDGWVHGGHVRIHGSLAGLRVTSVPQLSLQATAATDLPVRAGPGTTHGQVGLIAGGSTDRYDSIVNTVFTAPVPCCDHRHWFLSSHEVSAWQLDQRIDPLS